MRMRTAGYARRGAPGFALAAALMTILAVGQAGLAAPSPLPAPNPYNAVLADAIPELKGLAAPEWLLPGYRLFYDVYYGPDDAVMDRELLVIDVLGKGDGYVLSSSAKAPLDGQGSILGLEHEGYAVDFPGIGEAWISPSAIADQAAPAPVSGLFRIDVFENLVQYDPDGRAWVTTVEVEGVDGGSTAVDIYYGRKNGLALLFDIYVYGPTGDYIGGAAVQYSDYAVYEAPWMGSGFASQKEGSALEYGLKLEYQDGRVETGTVIYTVVENHGSWLRMHEERFVDRVKAGERSFVVSEFSLDGLMFCLPGGRAEGLMDGITYFYDGHTQAKVAAKGPAVVEGADAYEILFDDGASAASVAFRRKDGLMVRYIRAASHSEPYVTTLVYKGTR